MKRFPNLANIPAQSFLEDNSLLYSFRVTPDGKRATDGQAAAWDWKIFALADARARREIENDTSLPAAVKESLLSSEAHFVLDLEDGWLHGSIPDLVHENYGHFDALGHLRFGLNGEHIIAGRRRPLQSLDRVRLAFEQATTPLPAPLDFLDKFVSNLNSALSRRIVETGVLLDSIEVRIVGEDWQGERERLSDVRRRAVVLNRQIGSVNGVFRNLLQAHANDLPSDMRELFQEFLQRNGSLYHDVEQVQARARLLQDEVMARLSERSNNLLSIISIMTAVMLPATIVTGMFGMNTKGLPFENSPNGFWLATFAAILLAGLFYLFVRHLTRRY